MIRLIYDACLDFVGDIVDDAANAAMSFVDEFMAELDAFRNLTG